MSRDIDIEKLPFRINSVWLLVAMIGCMVQEIITAFIAIDWSLANLLFHMSLYIYLAFLNPDKKNNAKCIAALGAGWFLGCGYGISELMKGSTLVIDDVIATVSCFFSAVAFCVLSVLAFARFGLRIRCLQKLRWISVVCVAIEAIINIIDYTVFLIICLRSGRIVPAYPFVLLHHIALIPAMYQLSQKFCIYGIEKSKETAGGHSIC